MNARFSRMKRRTRSCSQCTGYADDVTEAPSMNEGSRRASQGSQLEPGIVRTPLRLMYESKAPTVARRSLPPNHGRNNSWGGDREDRHRHTGLVRDGHPRRARGVDGLEGRSAEHASIDALASGEGTSAVDGAPPVRGPETAEPGGMP